MATSPDGIEPLVPNPGGIVDPDDLVGRDRELRLLLQAIANGGAYVVGDRRMGKTSLIRKAQRELESVGHAVVYVSAETSDLAIVRAALLDGVRREGRLGKALQQWEGELSGSADLSVLGTGVRLQGSVKKTGSTKEADLLQVCAEAVRRGGPHRVVLFIDEISVLANHLHDERPGSGAEFLHSLRRSRQSVDGVSVVLAGSVGLHNAIADLAPINDLPEIGVGPLAREEAVLLGRRLIRDRFAVADEAGFAEALAIECSDIPYYIQRVVNDLDGRGVAAPGPPDVRETVEAALTTNAWKTDHYRTRIEHYYRDDAPIVRAAMDAVADRTTAMSVADLAGDLEASAPLNPPERSRVGQVLRKMQRDHYVRAVPGGYVIATEMLRRIWAATRDHL